MNNLSMIKFRYNTNTGIIGRLEYQILVSLAGKACNIEIF